MAFNAPMSAEWFVRYVNACGWGILLFTFPLRLRKAITSVVLVAALCGLYLISFLPALWSNHFCFLRDFQRVTVGMSTSEVARVLAPYQVSNAPISLKLPVNSAPIRKIWFTPDFSGVLHFNHDWSDPDCVDGFYQVTFADGKVTHILFYDD